VANRVTIMGQAKYLLTSLSTKVKSDIYDGSGKRIAQAGQDVILVPKTDYGAVTCKDGKTLREHWDSLSKTDHRHTGYEASITTLQANLSAYYGDLALLSERVRQLEQDALTAVVTEFDTEESE